jgi:predicted Rdx family selenoprotein
MHGIVHTIEGDLDNARYWYRKADREFPGAGAVKQEIVAARERLGAGD